MDVYFNIFKVKYDKLLDLFRNNDDVNIGSKDSVNIFINLEPILLKLCLPKVNEYIKANPKTSNIEFIANVINLAAHYKWFFTKHKIESRVYLYFPSYTDEYKNSIYNKDYRKYYKYKICGDVNNCSIFKVISESMPMIQTILEYIKGVYIINSKNIENSVIPYIINDLQDDGSFNFTVSTSLYDLQYVNFNHKIIVPKRDESALISERNVIRYIIRINECTGTYNITSNLLPFIISIIGSKIRNIYNIKGLQIKNAMKLLQTAINEKLISNKITSIHLLSNVIKPAWQEQITNNFYCTDIPSQYANLNKKDIYIIESQIKDRFDNVSLKKINDRYFNEHPIMITELTAEVHKPGVQY